MSEQLRCIGVGLLLGLAAALMVWCIKYCEHRDLFAPYEKLSATLWTLLLCVCAVVYCAYGFGFIS